MILDFQVDGPIGTTNLSPSKPCLYDRVGGKAKIDLMTSRFFHHIGKEETLMNQFFVNVPVIAIQLHQGKFFQVLFGPEEERCSPDELLDYMIATHVRLFRDLGLNETHFDTVANCFVAALNDCAFTQNQIDECVAIVGPLRKAFEYGAQVASQEKILAKKWKQDKMDDLPIATMETMRANKMAILPPGVVAPSQVLIDFFDGDRENVRAWTCALTRRFVVQDKVLRQLFSAIPYLEMEPYLHAFLELAFCPNAHDPKGRRRVLQTIRFPLGLAQAKYQLKRRFFERMIAHTKQVGKELLSQQPERVKTATDNLKSYRRSFVNADASGKIGVGSKTAHRLKRSHVNDNLSSSCRTATSGNSSLSNDRSDDTSVSSDISNLSLGSWGDVDFGDHSEREDKSISSSQRVYQNPPSSKKNPIFAWLRGRRSKATKVKNFDTNGSTTSVSTGHKSLHSPRLVKLS